nr:putative transposase, mutator type, MULE transposase domain protein [Tanacetum cinerariifolium]
MLRAFPMSLTRSVSRWLRNKPSGLITTWEDLKTKFLSKYCPPAQTTKKMEEINNFQQEPDETPYQAWKRFKEILMKCPQPYLTKMHEVILFYNGLEVLTRQILDSKAIQAELNNLGRKSKKVNKKIYAAQVGCEQCIGTHYTKDFPLKEEGKPLEKAYYTQFGAPSQGGGYRATAPRCYQRNNANPSYQERGFGSLPSSTEMNLTDHFKSISTTIEADTNAIRRMGLPRYAISTQHDRNMMFESKQATIPFLSHLNDYCCKEKKGSTMKYPKGIIENVLVGIGKLVFLVDFIIPDMPEDVKVPMILERPFLSTAHAKIDVFKIKITLRRNQVDDLMPIVEQGEVVDKQMIKEVESRDDNTIVSKNFGYPSDYNQVVENMDLYLDDGIGKVVVGEPFCKVSCVKTKRSLTSLDEGLYALACEEDVRFLATLVRSFKLIQVYIKHGVMALDSYIRPPRFRATIEEITDEPGIIAPIEHRSEKMLLLTWHDSCEPTKEPVWESVTPRSLPEHDSKTPCKDSVCEFVTSRCMPHCMLTPPSDEYVITYTQLSGVQGVNTHDHVLPAIQSQFSDAGFADVAKIDVKSSGLSHDELFRVDDLNLNLNEPINLNVSQIKTQSELPMSEEPDFVEDYVSSDEDAKQVNGQEDESALSDGHEDAGTNDDDDDEDEDFLVDEENEVVEPDVDVYFFSIIMDVSFDNIGVTNLVLDDVLEGDDVDVINADGFYSDPSNDDKISNYRRRRLAELIREMEGVINASGQWKVIARCDGKVPVFTMSQGTGPSGLNREMEAWPSGLSGPSTRKKNEEYIEYVVELHPTNLNTTVKIVVERNTDPSLPTRVLQRLYVCLGALKLGFRACRRELLGLDGAFMNGPFPCQVLAAVGLDSNNGIFPLAYALVEAKSRAKFDLLLNNICEVFNGKLVGGRDKPMITLLEYIRKYCMKRIDVCRCVGVIYVSSFTIYFMPTKPINNTLMGSVPGQMEFRGSHESDASDGNVSLKTIAENSVSIDLRSTTSLLSQILPVPGQMEFRALYILVVQCPSPYQWNKNVLVDTKGLVVGSIRRNQGIGYGVLEFLGGSWIRHIKLVSFVVFAECRHGYVVSSLMDTAYANGSESKQAKLVVSQDGLGGSGVGVVIGLSAADGQGGAGGAWVGVGGQGSSHSR